ncbi:hypothetical protein F5Y11DRAFT_366903 [Daldinia sp. FL1419]|nr:hypothetical protein F5Y11DRAFT_366903 [Daldinia sp. FL1419]
MTEMAATAHLDAVVRIPGCSSYLHLRKVPTSGHYSLIGRCRIGFRQCTMKTIPSAAPVGLQRLMPTNAFSIDTSGYKFETAYISISYGFDRYFMDLLVALTGSRIGKHIATYFKARDESLSNLQPIEFGVYFTDKLGVLGIWRIFSGWKVSATTGWDRERIRDMYIAMEEQLKFWTRNTTWKALDSIEASINSMTNLIHTWSDWSEFAKVLVAIQKGKVVETVSNQGDRSEYAHGMEIQTATRISLTESSASLSPTMPALTNLSKSIIQQLEFEPELFTSYTPGIDCEGGCENLSSAERVELGRLYGNFIRDSPKNSEYRLRDPLMTLGTETLATWLSLESPLSGGRNLTGSCFEGALRSSDKSAYTSLLSIGFKRA